MYFVIVCIVNDVVTSYIFPWLDVCLHRYRQSHHWRILSFGSAAICEWRIIHKLFARHGRYHGPCWIALSDNILWYICDKVALCTGIQKKTMRLYCCWWLVVTVAVAVVVTLWLQQWRWYGQWWCWWGRDLSGRWKLMLRSSESHRKWLRKLDFWNVGT